MFNKKDKPEEEFNEYSRDVDQTRYIQAVVRLCFTIVIGLFVLEICSWFFPAKEAFIFSAELVHTMLNLSIPILTAIGGYLWGKSKAIEEAAKLKSQLNGHIEEPTK